MQVSEFFEAVEKAEDLTGQGITDTGSMIVRHDPSGMITEIGYQSINDKDWATLYDILRGDREGKALHHITRVCGYYSRVDNWNESKLGELKDRHLGNYAV
jgi:hypothetical protein